MRSSVKIPRDHLTALSYLAGLDVAELDALVKRLEDARPTEKSLRAVFETVDEPNAFEALLSAAVFRSAHGMGATAAAEEFSGSLDDPEIRPANLATLFANKNVTSVAKVIDLRTTYERVLHVSRIITDARPVFDDNPEPNLLGSTTVHTLQLTSFGQTGALEDYFVALDEEDLVSLRNQIDRAVAKAARVHAALSGTPAKDLGRVGGEA